MVNKVGTCEMHFPVDILRDQKVLHLLNAESCTRPVFHTCMVSCILSLGAVMLVLVVGDDGAAMKLLDYLPCHYDGISILTRYS